MKKFLLALIFVLVPALASAAQGKDDAQLSVRLIADPGAKVYTGDSLLVSVVLYASAPIAQATCDDDLTIKGGPCRTRQLRIDRQATASQVSENGRIYYTLVWAQYVISPREASRLTIQPFKVKATLQQVTYMPDLIDQMMGARPRYREIKVAASSRPLTIEATEKPLRSTEEMLHDSRGTML